MKGRYLNARNEWEVAWNAALDRIDQLKKTQRLESGIDPYQEAWRASDLKRMKANIPSDEWNYERCERYTTIELENQKTVREWGMRYMPEEQNGLEKRRQDMNKRVKND